MIATSFAAACGIGLLVAGVMIAVITTVLAKISGDEISGWLPVWSYQLLESSVKQIPAQHQDRYREEWKAELAAFRERRVSALRFAWRLRRRAKCVHDALMESDGVGETLEPEPPPLAIRQIDAEIIAEIVRRAVERTRPRDQRTGAEVIASLWEGTEELDVAELIDALNRRYLGDLRRADRVRHRRVDPRQAGTRRVVERRKARWISADDEWSSMGGGAESLSGIARDAAHSQQSAELRRRANAGRRWHSRLWRRSP